MKIVFLDVKTIGTILTCPDLIHLGEVTKYNFTTPKEAPGTRERRRCSYH
mgnify:CR=1 FL=1